MKQGLATLVHMTVFRPLLSRTTACLMVLFFLFFLVFSLAPNSAIARDKPTAKAKAAKSAKASKAKVKMGKPWGNTAAVKDLATRLSADRKLPKAWVQKQIASAHFLPQVPQMVLPPSVPSSKNWQAYRERFLQAQRIQAGVDFAQQYADTLQRAETSYGVPASYILGVLGVETYFGQHLGKFRVLDTLTTLSLAFPKEHPYASERQAFFENELGHHLQQLRKQARLKKQLGSYAGASGLPQFMPSSIAKFAVDFDGDGRIDLSGSAADAIGSVAHYFQAYGWQTGMPSHFQVKVNANEADLAALLAPDIIPTWSLSHLQDKQVEVLEAQAYDKPLALVQLFNADDPPSYVAGTDNFFVITRYNRSSYYALAVIELGEEILKHIKQ
jgi:membrane-bound lytic murein transglycosylase B